MIELIMVFVIIGVVVAVTAPRVSRSTRAVKLDRARRTIASDMQLASALAARHRKPVRLVQDGTGYKIEERAATPTVYVQRDYGATSEYTLSTLTFAPETTYFFPNGIASNALTVTLASDGPQKQVTMTTAGFVRVPR